MSLLKKVRSHLGEQAHLIGTSHLHMNSPLVVIYAKILHQGFIPTIYEKFKSVFLLIELKRKFGNLHFCLI